LAEDGQQFISLGGTEIMIAIAEQIEDGIEEIIRHHQDRRIGDGKASELNIKITITPNKDRDKITADVRGTTKLASRDREPYVSTLYVSETEGGGIDISENNPKQPRLFDVLRGGKSNK
jgi:hypothetical protein